MNTKVRCVHLILVLGVKKSPRTANILTLETTPSPRLVVPLRAMLVQRSQIRQSEYLHVSFTHAISQYLAINSIPHASGLGNGYSNGHQIISISPTNSTNPVNIESSLANNENTRVPDKPGVEAVVNKTKTIEGTVTKNETAEDTSEDTKDTAEDTKDAAEDTKDTAEDTKDTTEDATENTTIESKVNITAAEIAI